MSKLRWHGDAEGFSDSIPMEWFKNTSLRLVKEHTVMGPDGPLGNATCTVSVRETWADLDYRAHAAINKRRMLEVGVLRLHFTGPDRGAIDRAEWQGTDADGPFTPADVTIENS